MHPYQLEPVRVQPGQQQRKVEREPEQKQETEEPNEGKLSTSKLAAKLGLKTADLTEKLISSGLLEIKGGKNYITAKGKEAGGEFRTSSKFGSYFLWPENLSLGE